MKDFVTVYGFGSFFNGNGLARKDIDILLVHESVDPTSIDFAIACKMILAKSLPCAHLTILSRSEEHELRFIEQCNATMLERVTGTKFRVQLASLALKLGSVGALLLGGHSANPRTPFQGGTRPSNP